MVLVIKINGKYRDHIKAYASLRTVELLKFYAVVFSYVLCLSGKYEYKVSSVELQKIIRKWIFMSTITGFYTGSTESEVEKQFADLRDVHHADEFVSYLNSVIGNRFTDDYFVYSLPAELNSSSANSPAWYGYIAAVNVLGTPMLFSTAPLSQYFVLGANGDKIPWTSIISFRNIILKRSGTIMTVTETRLQILHI